MAPIQTFMPGMYDYSMMQHPMSAVPFSPSVVDQNTLFSLVTTQL
jgi:la-related protein 1